MWMLWDFNGHQVFNGNKRRIELGNVLTLGQYEGTAFKTNQLYFTNEKKFTIDLFVKRLIVRCQKLDLRLGKTELQTTMEVSSFLTSLVKNYLFTGKFKRTA